jgi:hypothetical protein
MLPCPRIVILASAWMMSLLSAACLSLSGRLTRADARCEVGDEGETARTATHQYSYSPSQRNADPALAALCRNAASQALNDFGRAVRARRRMI